MKVMTLIMSLAVSVSTGYAQKLTDEEIEELKPFHYQTKLLLNLVPVYVGMGGFNFTSGYGVNADGFVGKYATISAGFTSGGYLDNNADRGNDTEVGGASDSYQGIKTYSESFANVSFHVMDKIGIGKIKAEKYKGTTTTSSGTAQLYDVYKKKGPVRKIIAVRGGVYMYRNGVVPETGDQWMMLQSGTTAPLVAATDRTFTTLSSTNFSVGLGSEKFVANSNVGGEIGVVSYFRNFYADLLINSSTTMDNHVDKTGNSYAYQFDQGTLSKSTMGWRVGWKLVGTGRKYWTAGWLIEGGVRPGIEGRGAYFQLGVLFGTKYPFKPMKE